MFTTTTFAISIFLRHFDYVTRNGGYKVMKYVCTSKLIHEFYASDDLSK